MDSYKESILEGLKKLSREALANEKIYNSIGTVESVDDANKTCSVKVADSAVIPDVRLQQDPSDLGLFIKPSIDSVVIISYTDNTTASIIMYSQIDTIVFQNGTNGGLTITPELKTQLDKMTARIDSVIDAIKVGVPFINDGGANLLLTQTTALNLIVIKEDFSDIENENFKH